MKLEQNQPAPLITTTDVFGNAVDLKAQRGKRIFLEFLRNVGCPVCNLRTHQLMSKAHKLSEKEIQIWLVFESPADQMRKYLTNKNYSVTFIADPSNTLYKKYHVERSMPKVMKSLLHGFFSRARQGTALYEKKFKQDGNMATIPAGFLIDENGRLERVHYGKFIGDHFDIVGYAEKTASLATAKD